MQKQLLPVDGIVLLTSDHKMYVDHHRDVLMVEMLDEFRNILDCFYPVPQLCLMTDSSVIVLLVVIIAGIILNFGNDAVCGLLQRLEHQLGN